MLTNFIDTAPLLPSSCKMCSLREKRARIFSMCVLPLSRFSGGAAQICHPELSVVAFLFGVFSF